MKLPCNDKAVDNLPFTTDQWLAWLVDTRHISLHVAQLAQIRFSPRGMTIPIFDEHGKHIFNKYRRAPWVTEGPKYSYEYGASAYLYGAHLIRDVGLVHIAEGECDALVLQSMGYYAVSSTGGASTFSPAWSELLKNKKVVLCYDADAAGVRGAVRVVDILGSANVAILPYGHGKDVTEIVHDGIESETLLREALANPIPLTNKWVQSLETLKTERTRYIQQYRISPIVLDMYIDAVHARIQEDKPVRRRARTESDDDDIARANSFPIQNLVKVSKAGFAHCIGGCKDKTASMKVYKDNHAYSFCCGKRHDAISIYRALNSSATFADTLKALI